jgi:hypothetical protein
LPTVAFSPWTGWIRFSAAGAHLCWRVKNGARSVPFKTLKTLPDGSELVILHESDGMLGKRRRDIAGKTAPRLPDTIARLIQFTVVTRTSRGRTKTSTIRVLTTLLDHAVFPAAGIAADCGRSREINSIGVISHDGQQLSHRGVAQQPPVRIRCHPGRADHREGRGRRIGCGLLPAAQARQYQENRIRE